MIDPVTINTTPVAPTPRYDAIANIAAPVRQTFLPVIEKESQRIIGYYSIAATTFDGTVSQFPVSSSTVMVDVGGVPTPTTTYFNVPLSLVNMPKGADFGHGQGVKQYVAAVYSGVDILNRVWVGFPDQFVSAEESGMFSTWSMSSDGPMNPGSLGIIGRSLEVGMAAYATTAATNPMTPPAATNAAQAWNASLDSTTEQSLSPFFDFNWIQLFNAKNADPSIEGAPISIDVVSNPAGGIFKATLVTGMGVQYTPQGGVQFNTIRIIRLGDAAPGAYVFNFNVRSTNGKVAPVTLTLNVT